MSNTELYINNVLCDIPANLGVRLNRLILNPSELNTKDAQYSYSISLPVTDTNNRIFNYTVVEESINKFNARYTARLYVDSVEVFTGSFKLSSISDTAYKGNLYIEDYKSVADIFGGIRLTDNAPLWIEFKDFSEYISLYNTQARNEPQKAIFPYVLYGLLSKVSTDGDGEEYTSRDVWDAYTRFGMQDLPPAINALQMIRHFFESRGLTLTGSAFNDSRLTNLYMSYRNESSYTQPWNYGRQARMRISGHWKNVTDAEKFEKNPRYTTHFNSVIWTSNLLSSTNADIQILEDNGGNILHKAYPYRNGDTWNDYQIMIPVSGFYKVRLKVDLRVDSRANWRSTDPYTGVQFVGGTSSDDNLANSFRKKRYEIKLMSDKKKGSIGLSTLDKRYYENNLDQTDNWLYIPKYFPRPTYGDFAGHYTEVMFIDPAQNPSTILGFGYGLNQNGVGRNPAIGDYETNANSNIGTILAGRTGLSWSASSNPDLPSIVVIDSPGYWRYGRLNSVGEDVRLPFLSIPDTLIRANKVFDSNGLLIDAPAGSSTTVMSRYFLGNEALYAMAIPVSSGWTGSVRVYQSNDESQAQTRVVAPFNTGEFFEIEIDAAQYGRYISLELTLNTDYDITSRIKVKALDPDGDAVGWIRSMRFRIEVGQPLNYAGKGFYKGVNTGDLNWDADGEARAVVWFEAGEILTVVSTSEEGRYKRHNSSGKYGMTIHEIDFELDIIPFRTDKSWAKINTAGQSTARMTWSDPSNFDIDAINLTGFLDADTDTDAFIDNFCKAFNLRLSQMNASTYRLDVKQRLINPSAVFVDLEKVVSIYEKENSDLGLPALYKIGFRIDEDEEGYVRTGFDGGGTYETGAIGTKIIEQQSEFSYNWFKNITKIEAAGIVVLPLPIISKAEVWGETADYYESMLNRYTNQRQRFFYYDGTLNELGATFQFNDKDIQIARVINDLPGRMILDYEDKPLSILRNYFTLLVDSGSNYTNIDAYLTPEEYALLDGSRYVRINGDLYICAEIQGYDPTGINKTKLKLIRKI